MSEANILKGELRENTGKSFTKSVRKEGNIPCIIYGDKKDPIACLLYTSPSPRDRQKSRMPSSA